MSLKGKSKFVITEEKRKKPENAYELTYELFDELRRQKVKNLIEFIGIIILSGFCVFFAFRNPYKVIVAEIRESTGEILNVKELAGTKIDIDNLSERQINYFLSNFITNIRSVTFDKEFYQKKLNESNYFLTPASQKELKTALTDSNTTQKIEKQVSVNVQIKNFNKIENNKYQLTWSESYTSLDGTFKEDYLGIFTIETIALKDKKMILYNPLGIVITQLSISKTN